MPICYWPDMQQLKSSYRELLPHTHTRKIKRELSAVNRLLCKIPTCWIMILGCLSLVFFHMSVTDFKLIM